MSADAKELCQAIIDSLLSEANETTHPAVAIALRRIAERLERTLLLS